MTDEAERQHTRFLAHLGATMAAANYPSPLISELLDRASKAYGYNNSSIVLPSFVQVTGEPSARGTVVESVSPRADFRFEQTFPLAKLIRDVLRERVTAADGEARLTRLLDAAPRYPWWVTPLGYGVWSAGLSLVVEPSRLNLLIASVLGVFVGLLVKIGDRTPALANLVPVLSAFLVTSVCIEGAQWIGLDHVGLRAIIPPLAIFLPGAAITLAVIELTSRDVVSGSARLIAGMMQLAQLAFGILVATQIFGVDEVPLTADKANLLGPWAPWLGVLVYSVGVLFYLAPPLSFLPWLLVVAYLAFAGQYFGDKLLDSYAAGFLGGTVLMVAALAVSRMPKSPPAMTMVMPGFWLLVPGGMGLIGFAEIFGADGDDALPSTLISMIAVSLGIQAGLALWQVSQRVKRPDSRPPTLPEPDLTP
ncbi:threonine/serine ThrE exporter family protein [Mycolicibacterium brumae]|uniref:Threonine/serine exporter-like N-terminal domain-containing protein n=1 Tax=Mycolicibacterium brumae TaxID=85968 RepID=A0A2G5P8H4_9MYCO|nr:threonine/serine exporter family protein [Mycolicibacterium brumae]MCV7194592.1 threonine/serine exporter family protein [Mycolicibacterium brumae]PIB74194.1 hypothetical protein CQY22_013915 [Mycolicibacterium brumae]RWA22970.1 hypothetical protein MBRU_11565 [Mycolicibacterium brumae DSM 44177]UWW08931.1 threonine/serine exporter family protein [Mycolicibacterium brumae]